jgi:hypothetical protein
LNSLILGFSTGVQVALIVNSRVGNNVDYYQAATNAYNNSWVRIG